MTGVSRCMPASPFVSLASSVPVWCQSRLPRLRDLRQSAIASALRGARGDAAGLRQARLIPSRCRLPIVADPEEIVGEVGITPSRPLAWQRVGANEIISVRVVRSGLFNEICNCCSEIVEADSEPDLHGRQLRGWANDASFLHPSARQVPPRAGLVDRRQFETPKERVGRATSVWVVVPLGGSCCKSQCETEAAYRAVTLENVH